MDEGIQMKPRVRPKFAAWFFIILGVLIGLPILLGISFEEGRDEALQPVISAYVRASRESLVEKAALDDSGELLIVVDLYSRILWVINDNDVRMEYSFTEKEPNDFVFKRLN